MEDVHSFTEFVRERTQNGHKITILALVGSGLSVSSGIQTYANNSDPTSNVSWRNYSAIDLATPDAFDTDPGLVWLFYAYRRHLALSANPNDGHYLLSKLSHLSSKINFLTITQNMDGLHQRAHHNPEKLLEFHGSLFQVRCTNFLCTYKSLSFKDPLTHSLDASKYSNSNVPLPEIKELSQLPTCPLCHSMLRPGVIWFGEALPLYLIDKADEFIIENNKIDLLLIIGTSHSVWPTSSYIDMIKNQGGNIAVFNTVKDAELEKLNGNKIKVWQFIGDSAQTLPQVFNPITEGWST